MLATRWTIAHNLHFAAAMFLLFGVVGIYQLQATRLKTFGHLAFVLALMGSAFFFASGVITAALMPVIAAASATLVRATGPFFNPPLPILVTSVGAFAIGWITFGVATARAGEFPSWTGWALVAGAVLQTLPPEPFGHAPWIAIEVGGAVMALGFLGIGAHAWVSQSVPYAAQLAAE